MHCRQAIVDNHRWLNQWSKRTKPRPHIFGDLTQLVPAGCLPDEGTLGERRERIDSLPLQGVQWCYQHNCWCGCHKAGDLEFSGLPCQENSRANPKRRFLAGRFSNLYAVWSKHHRSVRTPLIILENTEESGQESGCVALIVALLGFVLWGSNLGYSAARSPGPVRAGLQSSAALRQPQRHGPQRSSSPTDFHFPLAHSEM